MSETSLFNSIQNEKFHLDNSIFDLEHIGRLARMSVLDTEVDGSNPGSSMLFPWARHFIRIASVDSAVKWVPGGDNLVKDVMSFSDEYHPKITHFHYIFLQDVNEGTDFLLVSY